MTTFGSQHAAAGKCFGPVAVVLLLAVVVAGHGCGKAATEGETQPVAARPSERPAFVPPAPRPTEPLAPGISCINSACHTPMSSARVIHGVVRGGHNCMLCHQEDQGSHVYPLKFPGVAGCTTCHEGVVGQRIHQHVAADVECISCHDPHASEHGVLLKAASTATLCTNCHPSDGVTGSHPPFANGECTACHEPHESDFRRLLRGGEGAEHCYLCHEDIHDALANAEWVHPPARDGCLDCHQPHGSDHPYLMSQAIDDKCFSCHKDIEQTIAGVEAPHGAMSLANKCANCHDAHASNQPGLLRDRQDKLCLECHNTAIQAKDGCIISDMTASVRDREFLHGPVEAGNCSACHTVHGASQSRLLRDRFTADFYTSFDLKHYALCFDCHDNELVTSERTTALTDFRDGDLNLHYLHVNRQDKGRTCRACHEIHGSNLPSHIAESVPYGKSGWPLPIGFEPTDTGGSCGPGCHKPMSYDRVTPTLRGDR